MQFIIPVVLVLIGVYVWARRAGLVERPQASGRIPLVTEALAYVGGVLVLAGGFAAVRQSWDDMSVAGHVAILAATTAVFAVVGLSLRDSREPAFARLAVVSWVVSALAFAGTLGDVAGEVVDMEGRAVPLFIGGLTALYAFALWAMLRTAPQQLVLFAAVNVAVTGAVVLVLAEDPPPWSISITLWAVGLAWVALGWRRLMEPWWVAVPLGALGALVAPSIATAEHGWGYALGIATAAAVMAASVATRFVPGLPLGATALFGYVTWAVIRYFGDTLGVPTALATTGALVLVVAYVTGRLVKITRPPSGTVEGGAHERPVRTLRKAS